MPSRTVTISKEKYDSLIKEVETLRNSGVYKRLLEFERNISLGKKLYRKDSGF